MTCCHGVFWVWMDCPNRFWFFFPGGLGLFGFGGMMCRGPNHDWDEICVGLLGFACLPFPACLPACALPFCGILRICFVLSYFPPLMFFWCLLVCLFVCLFLSFFLSFFLSSFCLFVCLFVYLFT